MWNLIALLLVVGQPEPYLKTLPTGPGPYFIVSGDLNGNGKPDVALPCRGELFDPEEAQPANNTVTLYFDLDRSGGGRRQDVEVGFGPYTAALGDLDADGLQDIAVVNFQDRTRHLSILYGTKDPEATLAEAMHLSIAGIPFAYDKSRYADGRPVYAAPGLTSLAVGDFNEDGKPDIITVAWSSDFFSVLLNDGARRFSQSHFPLLPGPRDVAVADFNGDGHLDLAFTFYSTNLISIWHGAGTGNFSEAQLFLSQGATPYHLKCGDLDGDGRIDLVVGNRGPTDNVTVFHNTGLGFRFNGAFSGPPGPDSPQGDEIRDVLLHDADGDGELDLFAACHRSDRVLFWRGTGDTGYGKAFAAPAITTFPGQGPRSLTMVGQALGIALFKAEALVLVSPLLE